MPLVECLIIDDDPNKIGRLRELISTEIGETNVSFHVANSASEAVALLRSRRFDLMVVDINLPLRTGSPPVSDGGIKLLRQVARGTASLVCPAFVVGITSFDELVGSAATEFSMHGWTLVQYSPESTAWEETVVNQCKHITEHKRQVLLSRQDHGADVCLVTARFDVELEAVLALPCGFHSRTVAGDETRYSEGELVTDNRKLRIVACAAPEMGNAASAMLAMKVASNFRPKVCIMVGICAGIEAQVGDVAVAEFALHYESGKFREGEGGETVFAPEPRYQPASNRLLEAVRRFRLERQGDILAIPAKWGGDRPPKSPDLVVGPVASGAAVVEHGGIVDGLKFRDRKLVALEMETYGFYVAERYSALPKSEFIAMKAVCDLARPPKTDQFQRYAAFLSARTAFELLRAEALIPGGIFA